MKLENKIKDITKIATLALIIEACGGARVNSPAVEYATARLTARLIGEKAECADVEYGPYRKWKEKNCVYPILMVRF